MRWWCVDLLLALLVNLVCSNLGTVWGMTMCWLTVWPALYCGIAMGTIFFNRACSNLGTVWGELTWWLAADSSRLMWWITLGGFAIVNTWLTALLVGLPDCLNNVSQTELIFAVDIFLHTVSLTWFFKINANTHKPQKKRLAGYYPPAHEDKINCCCLLPRHYYLVLFHDETIKKHEQKKSPYSTTPEHPKSEKCNIPHITIIRGGQSKFFWCKFWKKKRAAENNSQRLNTLTCGKFLSHGTPIFSAFVICRVGGLSRSSTHTTYLYSSSRPLLMFPAIYPPQSHNLPSKRL